MGTPTYHVDPYPYLAELRRFGPAVQTPDGTWLVTRHSSSQSALRSHRLSPFAPDVGAAGSATELSNLLLVPPEDHARIRRVLGRAFTPRSIKAMEPFVADLVEDSLGVLVEDSEGEFDLIADFAYGLPQEVICRLLGIPLEDRDVLQRWSEQISAAIDPPWLLSPEDVASAERAGREFAVYMAELIEDRRRQPKSDLLSAMLAEESENERLTPHEVLANAIFLFVSGHESTVNLIGNGILALLSTREQWDLLRDGVVDPHLAVEEMLRFDSPLQLTIRTTTAAYDCDGVIIPPRERVVVLLGAANRDESVFDDADRLWLRRAGARRHVAFGGGSHFCLGAPLARMVGLQAISGVIRVLPDLELAGRPRRTKTMALRGLISLPVGSALAASSRVIRT